MPGKPLIISGSARKNGDTHSYLEMMFKGTTYQLTALLDYRIAAYTYADAYPEEDDFMKVVMQMIDADTIVMATPVYWYAMSGLMKTFFDRLTDLVTHNKALGRQLKNKSVFLLALGSDDELPQGFEVPFKLTADYFSSLYKGHLYICTKAHIQQPDSLQLEFLARVQKSVNT